MNIKDRYEDSVPFPRMTIGKVYGCYNPDDKEYNYYVRLNILVGKTALVNLTHDYIIIDENVDTDITYMPVKEAIFHISR